MKEQVSSPRFLFQEDFGSGGAAKAALLEEHSRRTDSVIVAPAFHEGLDLRDDLGRFAIILKMPYPSLGDKVVKERAERDPRWYSLMVALKLVQSYGRCIRSKTDWAYTYLLDSGLEGFMARAGDLIPRWMSSAFVKYAPKGVRRS